MSRKNRDQKPRIAQPPISASPAAPGQSATTPAAPRTVQAAQRPTIPRSAPATSRPAATLEQQRAAHALASVRALIPESDRSAPFATEYRSYVEALPATIVMNGLGQACATLLAASNGDGDRQHAYAELHKHLQSWLCRPVGAADRGGVYPGTVSLINAIVQNGQSEYVHAQSEALAYLVWLKKFSQAFLPRRS